MAGFFYGRITCSKSVEAIAIWSPISQDETSLARVIICGIENSIGVRSFLFFLPPAEPKLIFATESAKIFSY